MYKPADRINERWLCWPDIAVTPECIKGLCNRCDKPPHRRKQTRAQMVAWAATADISAADVNQGMLFRPIRKMKVPRR